MTHYRSRTAFTLLEVMLVMAILIIIMAVSYPSLEGLYGDTRVRGAADDVRGAWAEARVRAIDNGVGYRFCIIPGKEKFCIAPDSPEYWDGTRTISSDQAMDDGKVMVGGLPKGIVFVLKQDSPEESGGWHTIVTFLPDGTCRDDARIELQEGKADANSSSIIVSVRGLTGIVTVQTRKQEEGR